MVLATGGAGLVSAMALLLDDRPTSRLHEDGRIMVTARNGIVILHLCSKAEVHVVFVVPHALWLSEDAQQLSRASTDPRAPR